MLDLLPEAVEEDMAALWRLVVMTTSKLFIQKPTLLTAIADCNATFFGLLYQKGCNLSGRYVWESQRT